MPKDKDKSDKKSKGENKKEKEKDKEKKVKDKAARDDKRDKKDSKKEQVPAAGAGAPSRTAAARAKKAKQLAEPTNADYLAGMDLPSSGEEESDREDVQREDKAFNVKQQTSTKDAKKMADKERKARERALALKREALRDDENVFDVAYTGMGDTRSAAQDNATDVKVHGLTVRAKGKMLLDNTEVTIVAGRRYGLVGPNGKGKSTLLTLLAQRRIPVPASIDVMLVEQEVAADDRTALQAVVEADVELMELRASAAKIEEQLKDEGIDDDEANALGADLTEIYEALEQHGASTAEARASRILYGLGFNDAMRGRTTRSFSGGWRMRISLARALYIQPTLLLLDEPTNHLDLRAVLWLEEYLCRYKKTLVVVSHDRGFLNEVTTDIIHLHDEALHSYRGNFANFEDMYEQRRRAANKEFEKFEKHMKQAQAAGAKDKQREAQKKVQRNQAKAAQKGAGKGGRNKGMMEDNDENEATAKPRRWNDYSVRFEFPDPAHADDVSLLQLMDASFKYPGREDFGMSKMNVGIGMGSRICIVGPNGAGKTTLMNLVAGDLQPTEGDARRSYKLRIGRYAQHFVDALEMDDTPVEYLMRTYGHLRKEDDTELKEHDVRAMLGKFGLAGHHHHQPIVKLSGGQKARVVFVSIALSKPHILLLDEPTNHLDMQSIDALCEAVTAFGGGVVVISHDSTLLDTLCDDEERAEVWIVEGGEVKKWHSDFADYKESLIQEIRDDLDEDDRTFGRGAYEKAAPAANAPVLLSDLK